MPFAYRPVDGMKSGEAGEASLAAKFDRDRAHRNVRFTRNQF
jgi:hypothetical protein